LGCKRRHAGCSPGIPALFCATRPWPPRSGLGRRRGGFGFGDRGKRLHIEFLVVGIARHEAHLEPFHEQHPRTKVSLHIGWKPHFVVDKGLLENKARTLLHTGEQAARNSRVADKISFQPRDIMGFFVHPNDTGKFRDNFFYQRVRLGLRIRLKIETQNVLATKTLAAWVHELAGAQKDFDARLIFVFAVVFSVFGGLLLFGFFFGLALLVFFDALPDLLIFLFLFLFTERLAVFFHQRGDFIAVEVEEGGFARLVLLHFSLSVVFRFFLRFGTGVVFFDLVDGFLVVVNFFEEGLEVGQFDLGLDREIENALANGAVDGCARESDVVLCAAAFDLNPVGKFDTSHCSVVVVKDLFFDTANGRGFLHDQMSLPVEEHMALHTGGASYFKFQGLLAANLRDTHNRQRHFFLLWVDEARVVILGGRF